MALAIDEHHVRDTLIATGQKIMGRKGFSAVGLAEILKEAGVPKGSFYYYFSSKDAFGEALILEYFKQYHAQMDALFTKTGLTMADRLIMYLDSWRDHQCAYNFQGRCLAVKLGAEVSDLSEPMRLALKEGTAGVISRLTVAIEAGLEEGSLASPEPAELLAQSLYSLWLGASVMAKIVRADAPLDIALHASRRLLGIAKARGQG
ncbi:TetR/AcrR family transcriptional regulator [Acidisoma sp. C75]